MSTNTSLPVLSLYAIINASNGAMMQSSLLGNTIAKREEKVTEGFKPLYEDILKQATLMGKMEHYMQAVQIATLATMGIGLALGGVGAAVSGIAEGFSISFSAAADVAETVINGAVQIAEAGTSAAAGAIQVQTAQAQSATTLDQSCITNRSSQNSVLNGSLKETVDVNGSIFGSTAALIKGNARELTAYKARG